MPPLQCLFCTQEGQLYLGDRQIQAKSQCHVVSLSDNIEDCCVHFFLITASEICLFIIWSLVQANTILTSIPPSAALLANLCPLGCPSQTMLEGRESISPGGE